MLLRLMTGTMAGAAVAAGAVVAVTLGAGAVGAALLARRICEERRGWRDGAAAEPAPEVPPEVQPLS